MKRTKSLRGKKGESNPNPSAITADAVKGLRPHFKYSPEVVAEIAAKLLHGDDYKAAAEQAIALLDACEQCLKERWIKEELKPRLQDNRRFIPFTEAASEITGLKDSEYAREMYSHFCSWILETFGRDVDTGAACHNLSQQQHGLPPETVVVFREFYRAARPQVLRLRQSLKKKRLAAFRRNSTSSNRKRVWSASE